MARFSASTARSVSPDMGRLASPNVNDTGFDFDPVARLGIEECPSTGCGRAATLPADLHVDPCRLILAGREGGESKGDHRFGIASEQGAVCLPVRDLRQ